MNLNTIKELFDIQKWIVSLRKKTSTTSVDPWPSKSFLCTARSGVRNLFNMYEKTMSDQLTAQLNLFFKGVKRDAAYKEKDGKCCADCGTVPMPSNCITSYQCI